MFEIVCELVFGIVFGMFRALLICHVMFEFDVGIISVCELLVFMIGISVVL